MAKRTNSKSGTHPLRARASAAEAATETATPVAPAGVASNSGAARSIASQPSYEEIARRAYHLYMTRGASPGRALDDWLQAERELSGHGGRGGD